MYTKVRYSPKQMLLWTQWHIYLFLAYALAITVLYDVAGMSFLKVPWPPLAVIGTAVAFIVGFQNNAAYGRIWEARKIWGGIVNASRAMGIKTLDMVTANHQPADKIAEDELATHRRVLLHRHLAWVTALRHAMRKSKPWEEFLLDKNNQKWAEAGMIPERNISLEDDLRPLLSDEELSEVLGKANTATAILTLQSHHLRQLMERKIVWEFSFLEFENLLQELFALQGKSERIKNFPYPRQYATLSFQFVRIFVFLVPFAAIPEFAQIGRSLAAEWPLIAPFFVWIAVPFSATISWIFHTMERIGRVGENPFEGSANDVPISTIAWGIEIDLREMLGEPADQMPKPLPSKFDIQF